MSPGGVGFGVFAAVCGFGWHPVAALVLGVAAGGACAAWARAGGEA